MTENSKFFVFEGIDGCGKTTQIGKLSERIRASNKYQDILLTREPTWRDKLIRKALEEDSDPYSSAVAMSHQFIGDRAIHWTEQIKHSLEQEVFVICDRFSLSTCAYQSAQGVPLEELLLAHKERGIGVPRLTFYVDVSLDVARERKIGRREYLEKFEKDSEFDEKLLNNYRKIIVMTKSDELVRNVLGDIVTIDGTGSVAKVEADIWDAYSQRMKA